MAAPDRTYPFIARLTRAYLNFEVKDALKARVPSQSVLELILARSPA
jgi:hypothetical protein